MQHIDSTTIDTLYSSFVELESAISNARETLLEKGDVSQNLLERLNSYDEILNKQRSLTETLCQKIESKEWDAVSRIVSLINGLSSMLRNDTREILISNSLISEKEEFSKEHFC